MVESTNSIDIGSIISLTGSILLFIWVVIRIAQERVEQRTFYCLLVIIAAMAATPIGSIWIAGYLRGVFGDLSVTTLLFLVIGITTSLSKGIRINTSEINFGAMLCTVGGLCLYPFSLGLSKFDPYNLGYQSLGPILGLMIITLWCWYRERYLITITILCGVTAFLIPLYDSRNLWDYLLDPVIFIMATIRLTQQGTRHLIGSKI